MRGLPRRYLVGVFLALLQAGRPVRGQTTTPNTLLVSPPLGHFLVELEVSWNSPQAFVTDNGQRNDFPGSLGFGLGVLRVSYTPLAHFSVGVEAPYRFYRYDVDGFSRVATGGGSPGVGLFADWSPSGPKARLAFDARVESFFAFDAHGVPLSTGEGINRYSFAAQMSSPAAGGLLEGWRADGGIRVELAFGPTSETADRYSEFDALLRVGPRLAKLTTADVLLLAVGGYRTATQARQEGNFLRTNPSSGFTAGAMIELLWPGAPRRGTSFELSATREIAHQNSLDGWRATLTFRREL